jgi:predicted dinucleotide-binding enzyme
MTAITILGTGNMGSAISALAQKGGHTIQSLDSKDTEVPVEGEMVILAVPYPALQDVLAQRGDQLDGKILVDITNPVDFETFDSLTVSPDSSASAELESALSGARVLKAFNTNFAATLQSGTVGEAATTVLVAGTAAGKPYRSTALPASA